MKHALTVLVLWLLASGADAQVTLTGNATISGNTTAQAQTILFSWDAETGDFSQWDSTQSGGCGAGTLAANTVLPHAGSYSAELHFIIPGDQCASHQDQNIYMAKTIVDRTHFFLRGYVYLKTPEPGGTQNAIARKLYYLQDKPSPDNWSFILGVTGNNGTNWMTIAVQNGPIGGTSTTYYPQGVINYDTWYSIELEIQNSTVTSPPWNGVVRIWVNGTQWEIQDGGSNPLPDDEYDLNRGQNYPLEWFQIGQQADRDNFLPVDEYRYWDDIKIALSYIGP